MDIVDKFVGNKIKERRKTLKLSQSKLAELMGLSYQQIQKYESGTNKVTVKRLMQLANVMNVPATYFYEGVKLEEDAIGEAIDSDVLRTDRTNPINILLVEDNASDEILLRKAVEDCGEQANIHSISDPEQVIDYLKNYSSKFGHSKPDLIFLDLNMPKIDGKSLLKMIKKDRDILDTPIIILSNSINANDMTEIYKHQACSFIPKSVDYDDFSECIATTVRYWSKVVVLPHM